MACRKLYTTVHEHKDGVKKGCKRTFLPRSNPDTLNTQSFNPQLKDTQLTVLHKIKTTCTVVKVFYGFCW